MYMLLKSDSYLQKKITNWNTNNCDKHIAKYLKK